MRDGFMRLHVRTCFRELGLPTLHIRQEHMAFFEAAEITPLPTIGQRFDAALDVLGTEQLRALSHALLDPRVPA